jgi:hypothetical protein
MTIQQWLGILAAVLLLGFVFFAFRQGLKVKPDDREDRGPSVGSGGGGDGTDGGAT